MSDPRQACDEDRAIAPVSIDSPSADAALPKAPTVRPASRRRTQQERTADTRGKLIQAAIDLICERGYANLTTPEIAARAGVSRGALQHHFATRYDLIAAVNERLTNSMLALVEDLEAGKLPIASRVDQVVGRYWSVYTSAAYLAVLNIFLGLRTGDALSRRVRRNFVDIYRKSDAPWFQLFGDAGVGRGELAALRRLTLATLRGLAIARFLGIQREAPTAELAFLKATLLDRLGRRDGGADGPAQTQG
jgi:AcrR family transcriptional regulator